MTVLRARLLGALEVEVDGDAIDAPATQRPWALFAYLALAPRPVSRAELANTFWPDVLEQSGRASLRSALWALRRRLGDGLVVEGDQVGLREAGLWIDVREFERLAGADPGAALELSRGDLLQGLEADWVLQARERHRQRVIALLERQAADAEGSGDAPGAIALTRRQTEVDRFDEQAHRRLMERLAAGGDVATAVRVYRGLGERLRRELGVAPSAATRQLAEELRAGDAPANTPAPPAPASLPIFGRERELAALERAWRAAAQGRGSVVSVRGEAGIGKSRVATELRQRAAATGGRSATCAALDLGGTAPLSLWAELIRDLLPTLPAPPADAAWPDDLAVVVSELPAHFGRSGGPALLVAPDLQRTRLFEAVVALLAWAARAAPLLLVLEDLHDADGATLELAAYAARRVATLPVMIVFTRRQPPENPDCDRVEQALRGRGLLTCELELGPLPSQAMAALARRAANLEDRQVARIVEQAEGNPLLAVETARALAAGEGHVAPNLRGSVRAALAHADGDVRELVEVAAVAARPMEPQELDAVGLPEAATPALQTGLLVAGEGRVGFRHALIREAAYKEIAEPRRRALHQRWARALLAATEASGAPAQAAEVARHLRYGAMDAAAVPHLLRAAADARAVAALEQAVEYLKEALGIAPELPGAWLELGELEAWRAHRAEAEIAFEHAVRLLADGDPLEQARAWLCRARAYHGPICIPRLVLDSAERALQLLGTVSDPACAELSEALAASAWAEAVAGSVEQGERLLARLSTLASGSDRLRTYDAGHARALLLMRRGRFAESYGPSIAAGEAIGGAGRPDLAYGCWANAASAATAAGEHERALEFLQRGLAALCGHGLQSLEIHLLAARSFVLRGIGRLDEARSAAEAELALAEQVGQPELMAMASHDLGLTALAAGDYTSATVLLGAALAPGAPISRPLTRLALAEAFARSGAADEAAEQVRETVLEPVRPSDFPESLVPRLARVQGLIALAREDRGEAIHRLQEAVVGWERLLQRTIRADSITGVLADLGRPVVGLVEPERELEHAQGDLQLIRDGGVSALVP